HPVNATFAAFGSESPRVVRSSVSRSPRLREREPVEHSVQLHIPHASPNVRSRALSTAEPDPLLSGLGSQSPHPPSDRDIFSVFPGPREWGREMERERERERQRQQSSRSFHAWESPRSRTSNVSRNRSSSMPSP
ncbi:hypothetical protein KIPB_013972, partial [Kipferlia bialata]